MIYLRTVSGILSPVKFSAMMEYGFIDYVYDGKEI